jgi:hypothetical protein
MVTVPLTVTALLMMGFIVVAPSVQSRELYIPHPADCEEPF